MSEPSCENCKHWHFDPNEDWEYALLKVGDCKAIPMRETIQDRIASPGDGGDWDAYDRAKQEVLASVKAFVVDGSSYYAALRTRKDFACVLFEPGDTSSIPSTNTGAK